MANNKRIIIGISGASGTIYAYDLLKVLHQIKNITLHLVVSNGAKHVLASEGKSHHDTTSTEYADDITLSSLESYADQVYKNSDIGAAIASGSFRNNGMIIAPCSAGTLAKIAHGFTDNLLTRAAHVQLKEKRPLVLIIREAPYSRPMINNMLQAHDAGAIILPASPHFYSQPQNINELIGTVTARALDLVGIEQEHSPRWKDDL